ncbi:hypothetical protein GCM10011514_12140 [Emticicia aquatilis]|uniref:Carboxypeptidase-like regulatory domain-containing protein n=1 Tax=Emticicia aquatilis TaxID=1537369 RepID=A0A916YKM3_9BACT|nr:DUF5686 and carboxypeptidase-like regulatory domain-containing protein [Emticicia aquatilis]GGD49546.1 hypothetical protein GCM10011514_12140 [Emticicia aquatilis]
MFRLLLTLLLLPSFLTAQSILLNGKIFDETERTPLPFVSIRVKNTSKGTQSNADGEFSIKVKSLKDTLVFSFVGYATKQFSAQEIVKNGRGIFLKSKNKDLNEVVVRPEENPAWEIIRRTLKNKEQNAPDKLDSYQCDSYTKIVLSIDSLKVVTKRDTSKLTRKKSATLYVQENYSKIIYEKPARKKETIIASIGNWPVTYTYITNVIPLDVNPFGFYNELFNFTLLKRFYVNPLNQQTFKQYDFELKDTLIHETDSTFIINFKPYKSKNFEGLTGTLQINSAGYALENLKVKPSDTLQFTSFELNQTYHRVSGKWFPLKSEMNILGNYGKNGLNGYGKAQITSIYSNAILDQDIDNKLFDESNREMLPNATVISTADFKKYRTDSLTKREKDAYELFHRSSKTEKLLKLDSIANPYLMGMMSGVYEIGKFEVLTDYLLLLSNSYERVRIGIGFQNNQRLKPKFRIMGTAGYGIYDKKFKYQGIVSWHITPDRYNRLSLSYKDDYGIPASTSFLKPNYYMEAMTTTPYSARDSVLIRVDRVRNYGISLYFRPLRYTWWKLSLENELRIPKYKYQFAENMSFQTTEVKLDIRFAYREILNRVGRIESVINRWYPIINLQFVRGLPSFNGNYDYWKINTSMEYQIRFKRIGFSEINLNSGYSDGKIPYPFLYGATGGRGTISLNAGSNTTSFKTLPYGAYLSDRFISLTTRHNFGRTLIRPRNKYIQPSITLFNNIIYGDLSNPQEHQSIVFSTLNKGYFEAGIEIKDLVRVPFKSLFLGTGLGFAYHYGKSSSTNIKDNFRVYWLGILPSF